MFAVKVKIYRVIYNQSSSIAFDETSSLLVNAKKANSFSAFHWSPHGILVSIDQHFVTTRVVHLPKSTETSLITELDLITEPDPAVRPCVAAIAGSHVVRFVLQQVRYKLELKEPPVILYTWVKPL